MKTEIIKITANGSGNDLALDITRRTAAYCDMDRKQALRLRLLSEEILGFLSSFEEAQTGDFWLETVEGNVEIHLATDIPMDLQTRRELLAVSSSGKNSAATGFMGMIREMVDKLTLPDDPETKAQTDQMLGLMQLGAHMNNYAGGYTWAMSTYQQDVDAAPEAAAEKDDLEKSIVANIADEVKVNIVKSNVEIVISKAFS
ncbi:MAG: hypothetical protein K5745_04195 [Saccharofermentans sp.]|nr:hypothetical protein [Saccharofermentans sp.]